MEGFGLRSFCLLQPQQRLHDSQDAVGAPALAPAFRFVRKIKCPMALQGLVAAVPGSARDALSK